jgi:O-antigen/teichoic acid export membrane protein
MGCAIPQTGAALTTSQDQAPPQRSLTAQTFWFAAAKTIAFGLSVIFPFLLVRLITQDEFGLYKQAFLVTSTSLRILSLGFGLSAFYFFPRARGNEAPVAANILAFNSGVGLAVWIVLAMRPQLLASLFNNPGLLPYSPLIGAVIFLWMVSSFVETGPAAMQDTKISTLMIVGVQLSRTVFLITATLAAASLTALLWASIAQGLVQTIVMLAYLQHRFPGFYRKLSASVFRSQMVYVLPLSVASFIVVLQGDVPQYLVASHFAPALFAIYATGTFSLPLIQVLHESVGMVMIPLLSRLHQEGRFRDIVLVQASAMRKMSAITLPVYFCLLILAEPFIVVLYTKAYRASAAIFAVNITLLPLMIIVYDPLIRVYAETRRYLMILRALLLIFLAVSVTAGVRQGSMTMAVYSVVTAAAIERFAIGWKLARTLGIGWKDRRLFADIPKFAACSVAAAVVTYGLRLVLEGAGYRPIIILLAGGWLFFLVYAALVILLRIPRPEEYQALMNVVRRLLPLRNSSRIPGCTAATLNIE